MTMTFQPPPGGVEDAVRRGHTRRRRRRALGAVASGSTVTALATVMLSMHPGAFVTLRQDLTARYGYGAPQSGQPSAKPHRIAGPIVTVTQQPPAALTPGSSPGGATSGSSPAPASSPTGPPVAAAALISTTPTQSTTDYNNLTPCADSTGRQTSGWCVQPGNSFTGPSGKANPLSVSLCRLPGVMEGQASFPTTSETSFSLLTASPADTTLWSLDAQHPAHPDRHQLPVAAGQCLTWRLTWFGKDNTGKDLPAGHYTLKIHLNADNITAPNQEITENYDYTVTG